MTPINFSAAILVKSSCRQVLYFRTHPQPVNEWMIKGSEWQEEQVSKIPGAKSELCGTYTDHNIRIFFTNDCVEEDKITEFKMVSGAASDYYFNNSILQAALYKSMIMLGSTAFQTAEFRMKQGYPLEQVTVAKDIPYLLNFGGNMYEISVTKPQSIVDFFVEKARHATDWNDAAKWDAKYKYKEYQTLKDFITFKAI